MSVVPILVSLKSESVGGSGVLGVSDWRRHRGARANVPCQSRPATSDMTQAIEAAALGIADIAACGRTLYLSVAPGDLLS
jgi:hypothetical protein